MRRVIAFIGRSLITLGILVLLFVAYQLWGTGIYESRAQDDLKSEFRSLVRNSPTPSSSTTGPTTTTVGPTTTTTTTAPPPAPPPSDGSAVAHLVIPKIGVDKFVVEGVGVPDLRKGPGHYPTTPLPGHVGNSGIAGHRTTYGAPFGDLDKLGAGDHIRVTTREGSFEFVVDEKNGIQVVKPGDLAVLRTDPADTAAHLTLTTCNPKYSASERLVVKATLAPFIPPLPAQVIDPTILATSGAFDLSGESSSLTPMFLWGAIVAAVGFLWWLLFHRHAKWTNWVIGVIPFAVVLFFFYSYVERALPANY